MDKLLNSSLSEFTERLASSNSVPGGGGAAAMTGAMGAALGCMVCNLSIGKPKLAAVEYELRAALEKLEALRAHMLTLVDEDAKSFEPLEKCFAMPKDAPGRGEKMEAALRIACSVPAQVISSAAQAIELLAIVAEKGTKSAISDVGIGLELCKAAILSSKLNIDINAALMKDKEFAASLQQNYRTVEAISLPIAEKALAKVSERIG